MATNIDSVDLAEQWTEHQGETAYLIIALDAVGPDLVWMPTSSFRVLIRGTVGIDTPKRGSAATAYWCDTRSI